MITPHRVANIPSAGSLRSLATHILWVIPQFWFGFKQLSFGQMGSSLDFFLIQWESGTKSFLGTAWYQFVQTANISNPNESTLQSKECLYEILQSKRLSGFGWVLKSTHTRKEACSLIYSTPSPLAISTKPQGRVAGLTGIQPHSKALQTREDIDTDHTQEGYLQTIWLAPDKPVYLGISTIWDTKQVVCWLGR